VVRAQQFYTAKSFLVGDGRTKDFRIGLLQGRLRTWFDAHFNKQDEHLHLTISA
jgi:hypothetical protein